MPFLPLGRLRASRGLVDEEENDELAKEVEELDGLNADGFGGAIIIDDPHKAGRRT